MKTLRVLLKMMRWRASLTLIIFALLGVAWSGGLEQLDWRFLVVMLCVMASYAAATSANDIADEEIDKINLPNDRSRPLVSGSASRKDLQYVFALASSIAIVGGFILNPFIGAIFVISLFVNISYSLPPLTLSHRTLVAPFFLPLGYVAIPFLSGIFVAKPGIIGGEILVLAGLYSLFIGRIILKDFRDRKGDAAVGKITFLLKYGKKATLAVAILFASIGYAVLFALLFEQIGMVALFATVFWFMNIYLLWRLFYAKLGREEQITIGIGAKIGSGFLLTMLVSITLSQSAHSLQDILAVTAALSAIYCAIFLSFLKNPAESRIVYKK